MNPNGGASFERDADQAIPERLWLDNIFVRLICSARMTIGVYVRLWPDDLCEPLWANRHAGWCGAGGEKPPATRLCEFLISFQVHTPALEQDTLGICQQERGEQGSRSDIRQRTLRRGPRRIASPEEQGLLWPADRISGASLPRIRVPAQKADIATCCPCSDPGTRGHDHNGLRVPSKVIADLRVDIA